MRVRYGLLAVAGMLALPGCHKADPKSEAPYPMTVQAAQQALLGSHIPDGAFFDHQNHSLDAVAQGDGVKWITRFIPDDPRQQTYHELEIDAVPVAANPGVRFVITVQAAPDAIFRWHLQKLLTTEPDFGEGYRQIAHEVVDSTLNARPFNFDNIKDAVARTQQAAERHMYDDVNGAEDKEQKAHNGQFPGATGQNPWQ